MAFWKKTQPVQNQVPVQKVEPSSTLITLDEPKEEPIEEFVDEPEAAPEPFEEPIEDKTVEAIKPIETNEDDELAKLEAKKLELLEQKKKKEELARLEAEKKTQQEQVQSEVQPQQRAVPILVNEFDMLKILYEKIENIELHIINMENKLYGVENG